MVAPAVRVNVELAPAVTLVGLNAAVAPAGRPVTESETVWAAPEVTAVPIVEVTPAPPCTDDTLVGLALIEKSFATGPVMVQLTVAVCVADAPVPVIVSDTVPAGVVAPAVRVKVELAPAVTLVGLKAAVAPAGSPLTESETVCAAPEVTAVLMVEVAPAPPCTDDTLVGLALIEKSLPAAAPQPGSLNEPIWVRQLNAPFAGMYSVVK